MRKPRAELQHLMRRAFCLIFPQRFRRIGNRRKVAGVLVEAYNSHIDEFRDRVNAYKRKHWYTQHSHTCIDRPLLPCDACEEGKVLLEEWKRSTEKLTANGEK